VGNLKQIIYPDMYR